MHLCRSSSNVPCLPSFLEMLQNPHVLVTFDKVHNPHAKRHLNLQKWSVHGVLFLYILTWKCASRHNGVSLFRHRNFQKWSEPLLTWKCASRHNGVHFFDISFSKSAPSTQVLYILTCKCASRHNGVQFFISHLASWLRTRRFSEPTFRPSGDPNHWKNTVFRDFPTFSRICIFFLLMLLSSNLSLLSASSLLCFSSVHIVGSLTSKLPSISHPFIHTHVRT